MRLNGRTYLLAVLVAGLALAATACPGQPTGPTTSQPLPAGATVIASAARYNVWLADASSDLTSVLYGVNDAAGSHFRLYDDTTRTSRDLGVQRDAQSAMSMSMSGDGRVLVFSSADPALQVGPVAKNCRRSDGFFQPLVPIYCAELYRLDPDSGEIQQLTGLGGSSPWHNTDPGVSDDGSTVTFTVTANIPESGVLHRRLDLGTGTVVDLPDTTGAVCCRVVRGTNEISWDAGALYATDLSTSVVTRLSGPGSDDLRYFGADGHFVVEHHTDGTFHLIDTDARTDRVIPVPFISADATRYVGVQEGVTAGGGDRLIIGDVALAAA